MNFWFEENVVVVGRGKLFPVLELRFIALLNPNQTYRAYVYLLHLIDIIYGMYVSFQLTQHSAVMPAGEQLCTPRVWRTREGGALP